MVQIVLSKSSHLSHLPLISPSQDGKGQRSRERLSEEQTRAAKPLCGRPWHMAWWLECRTQTHLYVFTHSLSPPYGAVQRKVLVLELERESSTLHWTPRRIKKLINTIKHHITAILETNEIRTNVHNDASTFKLSEHITIIKDYPYLMFWLNIRRNILTTITICMEPALKCTFLDADFPPVCTFLYFF